MPNSDELSRLMAENLRLKMLLEEHGIGWPPGASPPTTPVAEPSRLSAEQKISLFRRLFRGRTDVYPLRWESKAGSKSGYSPACANEWREGICEKPRIKCSECPNRQLKPVTDSVIYGHLAGIHTAGIYPLLQDDSCYFLAVDFDEAEWQEDSKAFMRACNDLNVPAATEISRSGQGAHVWIFFEDRVPARDARRLGTSIISYTCSTNRQLTLSSYDRLFPNQDCMPKGGFGNLIALPLQKKPREIGCSVFVDIDLRPYPDQWEFLAALRPMAVRDVEAAITRAAGNRHPLDVSFIDEEDLAVPWKRQDETHRKLPGSMPKSLKVTLANLVYFEKKELPQQLANRLVRLAAFQNPEFYRAQAMRMSVWDKPRVIGSAENFPQHIGLPRGCLDAALSLLKENGIASEIQDERYQGEPVTASFSGQLRPDQAEAVRSILQYDIGVLCAPTGFGKTVIAAEVITRRSVNTLILVHRTDLLKQWKERLQSFLTSGRDEIGTIGGGKSRATGKIDISVMQSLSRQGTVNSIVENYGQIIVDECHHVGAVSFDAILKMAKAKYVLGLTATPIRRDGQQPIIFMQCGPIRHSAVRPGSAPQELVVTPRLWSNAIDLRADAGIQEVFRRLSEDHERTEAVARMVTESLQQGRKVLVLTERTDHLAPLSKAIGMQQAALFVLHGRMSRAQRSAIMASMEALSPSTPRVLLATGRLVGEGFDHPPLDTLVLAMPVSWKGTLQQYAGRLHREHDGKTDVRIIDFVDTGFPALLRMWKKRQVGYRAMGYRIESGPPQSHEEPQAELIGEQNSIGNLL